MATTMNAIADAIQPSALEALLTQTLADEAGLNDVADRARSRSSRAACS